jgi:DNA-directed RNA polymerase specialized sigma24 family protein
MIAAKARSLEGRHGLGHQDRPDIEQDLAVRIVDRLRTYDPARGTVETFIAMVIEQAVANLVRERTARKRTPPPRSPVPTEDVPDPLADEDIRHIDLASDVAAVIAKLPAKQRVFAQEILEDLASETSRPLGLPRTTVYGRVKGLRAAFERSNLRDYF